MEKINNLFSGLPISVQNIWAILLIIAIIFMIKYASKRLVNFFFGALAVAFIFQLLYALGLSKMDEFLHFSKVFKYDVFSYIATFFGPESVPGKILTTANNFLTGFVSDFATWMIEAPAEAIQNITNLGQGATETPVQP